MDSPTLSTVQSLGILSGVEALLTRDARGWLYSGKQASPTGRSILSDSDLQGWPCDLQPTLDFILMQCPLPKGA